MADKAQAHGVRSRRRLVRRLFVEGWPEGEIVRQLVAGVEDLLGAGGVYQVSESTARRDLVAVKSELAGSLGDQEAQDAEVLAAFMRYKLIAARAMGGFTVDVEGVDAKVAARLARPNLHAAIAATDRVVKIAALGSAKWGALSGVKGGVVPAGELPPLVEGEDELVARARELARMDTQDLAERQRQLQERIDHLGLEVHQGAKSAAGGE